MTNESILRSREAEESRLTLKMRKFLIENDFNLLRLRIDTQAQFAIEKISYSVKVHKALAKLENENLFPEVTFADNN